MLLRYDPFEELDRMSRQMWGRSAAPAVPMDAFRREGNVQVLFDLPGIDPSSIDLTVEKNTVTVKAERRHPHREGEEVLVHERPEGRFTRQIMLGDTLDLENLEASYQDGVLQLTIPESERAKPRRISVGGSGGEAKPIETSGSEQDRSSE